MKEKKRSFNIPRLLLAALVGLALLGCPVDSPTAPQQTPVVVGGSSGAWAVTVVASPISLLTDDELGSTITISIQRADGSGAPPDGATAAVSTTLGNFLSLTSVGATSLAVELFGGIAQLLFFPGDLAGTATIQAQIEESVGQAFVSVTLAPQAPLALEITGIDPTSGPYFGGTLVTIYGNGFVEPMILELGGLQQEETLVSGSLLTIRTEPITATTSCSDKSGSTSIRLLETGATATGPSFTYLVPEFGPVVEEVVCTLDCAPDGIAITQAGGSTLRIGGQNFRSPELTVGGQSRNLLSASTSTLTAISPAFGDSFFDTETCTGGSETGLVATAVTVSVRNGETSCSDSFTGSILVKPAAAKTCP